MPLHPSAVTVFAETNFRNQRRKFGIKVDDRRRHMYAVGKTGMGKSTLLENMVVADIRAGNGVALVDPHGDLAEKVLNYIPNERVNDVIYFNPSDTQYPIAFNILETIGPDYKHLVAYGLVGVFKKIWADSWGPRMEYIMTNTILALLDYPGSTLLGLMRMLVDKGYRKKVLAKITDPVVKTFWADEFANYSEKFRTEAIAPIQNKVGQFLSSSIIRNIVGQSKSTIEMRKIMDERKILIMNLAKGRIGEENSALLGAMMITKLQIAAMSRVDIPEEERKDFYLYVDEFQNFATDSFAGILSEARKYRLCLIMAHQYFEQLNDVVKAAVFGNVGTLIVFRVGATDAAELELEFAPQFLPTDIVNLKKYTFCIRLMVDGVATEPFSAIGLPPVSGQTNNIEKVIRVSRERYARPQAQVEERIIRWSGVEVARPQGQGEPVEATTDYLGDEDEFNAETADAEASDVETDMDLTGSAAVATTTPDATATSTNAKSISLGQSNEVELSNRLRVNASNLIPDDTSTLSVNPSVTAQVTLPAKVVLQSMPKTHDAAPSAVPTQVRLVPEAHQPVMFAAASTARRPKIDFVQIPAVVTPDLESEPQSVGTTPPEMITGSDSAEEFDGDDEDDEAEASDVTIPALHAGLPGKPSQPRSENHSSGGSVAPAATAGVISLRDLQSGNVPRVSFRSGVNSTQQVTGQAQHPTQQPQSISGEQAPSGGMPGGGQGRKRKRKRKRKSGSGENWNQSGQSGQASTAVGQTSRPANIQSGRPVPLLSAVIQPTRVAQPNNQPRVVPQPQTTMVQSASTSSPSALPAQKPTQSDANKVSLSGLI